MRSVMVPHGRSGFAGDGGCRAELHRRAREGSQRAEFPGSGRDLIPSRGATGLSLSETRSVFSELSKDEIRAIPRSVIDIGDGAVGGLTLQRVRVF